MPSPRIHTDQAEKQRAYRQRQEDARLEILKAKAMPRAPAIPTMPGEARWKALNTQARAALETIQTEMQDYCDNRSEAWQESDKAEAFQERIEAITDQLDGWSEP